MIKIKIDQSIDRLTAGQVAMLTRNSTQQLFFLVTIAQARATKFDSVQKVPEVRASFFRSRHGHGVAPSIFTTRVRTHLRRNTHLYQPTPLAFASVGFEGTSHKPESGQEK